MKNILMFDRIWKKQIVKPTSKVGFWKPKEDIRSVQDKDENKCMKKWDEIADYISTQFRAAEKHDWIYSGKAAKFKDDLLYHSWKSGRRTSFPELNPWTMFAISKEHYKKHDYIANLEPGIIPPENEEQACRFLKLIYDSTKKNSGYFRTQISDGHWDAEVGIDTRNIMPFGGESDYLQFILLFEYDTDEVEYVLDWFIPFIWKVGKMVNDAVLELDLREL